MTERSHDTVVTEKDLDKIICHIFLQTLMKRSYIPMAEAQEILDSLGEAAVGRGMFVGLFLSLLGNSVLQCIDSCRSQ